MWSGVGVCRGVDVASVGMGRIVVVSVCVLVGSRVSVSVIKLVAGVVWVVVCVVMCGGGGAGA